MTAIPSVSVPQMKEELFGWLHLCGCSLIITLKSLESLGSSGQRADDPSGLPTRVLLPVHQLTCFFFYSRFRGHEYKLPT